MHACSLRASPSLEQSQPRWGLFFHSRHGGAIRPSELLGIRITEYKDLISMKLKFIAPNSHPSATLGVLSLLLGIAGSGIGYLGLYLKQDMMGLIAVIIIGFAVLGALASLIWNVVWTIRGGGKRP